VLPDRLEARTSKESIMSEAEQPASESDVPRAPRRTRRLAITIVAIVVGAAVLIVAVVVLSRGILAPQSVHYHSAEFGYSVTLPERPTVVQRTSPDGQPAQRVDLIFNGEQIAIESVSAANDIAASRVQAVQVAGLAGSVHSLGGTRVRDESTFTLDGAPARSELYDSKSGDIVYEAVVVRGSTIYVIVITNPVNKLDHSILSSFRFTS
jgi:hypothetical protein